MTFVHRVTVKYHTKNYGKIFDNFERIKQLSEESFFYLKTAANQLKSFICN